MEVLGESLDTASSGLEPSIPNNAIDVSFSSMDILESSDSVYGSTEILESKEVVDDMLVRYMKLETTISLTQEYPCEDIIQPQKDIVRVVSQGKRRVL